MTSKVVTIEGNRTALEAAKLMNQKRIGSLVVTKANVPVGIIREHDIVEKVCDHGLARDCAISGCICCKKQDHSMVMDGDRGVLAYRQGGEKVWLVCMKN
jgi:hypothetical protein